MNSIGTIYNLRDEEEKNVDRDWNRKGNNTK
jgi:hypothetical protein